MSAAPQKDEFVLEYSDRNSAKVLSGYQADAKRIQSLLFGHGRAGDFDLGVDIQSYLYELSDEITLNTINSLVRNSIAKYCPNINLKQVEVDILKPSEITTMNFHENSLILGFSLGKYNTDPPYEFAIIARSDDKRNIISEIIL
jgi:phage baseplate assembly protein W